MLTLDLWEAGFLIFVAVGGVSFGLGTLLLNRQHVISTMRAKVREDMDELRAGFKRDLEVQLIRLGGKHAAEVAELRSEIALARQDAAHAREEAHMNAQAALKAERRIEYLEQQLGARTILQASGDINVGRDVAGRDIAAGE